MASNCRRCGKYLEPLSVTILKKPMTIDVAYCFECAEAEIAQDRAEKDAAYFHENLAMSKIPSACLQLLKKKSKLTNEQIVAAKKLKSMDIKDLPSPYIWGSVGCGKTFLACAMIYRFMKMEKQPAVFVSISNLISSRYYNIEEDPSALPYPIVLDDLGNHVINQKIVATLFNFINYRLNEDLPTIITCNTDPISLGERFVRTIGGAESYLVDSLCDRILELCKPVKIEGKSIRTARFIAAYS